MKPLRELLHGQLRTVLCLGAHADDLEIGCGGTLLRLLQSEPGITVHWVVFSAERDRRHEAIGSAEAMLACAASRDITICEFEDRYFPAQTMAIKQVFDGLGRSLSPDLIFTHYREDLHQDHRTLAELTWNTFRNHHILEYEIPKYEGDLGRPNVFVELSQPLCRAKIDHVLRAFPSQAGKYWFSDETFWAMLRLRGIECRSASGYAEAFHGRKLLLS
jgi:LmbE family N-acetylglucosaminyl deacetylase